MPRYDDRYGTTRLYLGRLSSRTRSRDLEYLFRKYGSGGKSCRVLGDFGDTFCSLSTCFYGIGNNPNWCLVCLDGRCMIHFNYLSNDDLTVSGNHLRRIRDVDMKHDFAFVEFSDPRDADDARYSLNGRDLNGSRLLVEFAKGTPRGPGGSREYLGRGPPPGSGRCFNCGLDGHWARDCKAVDWKNKCYRCGERGHIERNCQNSPKKLKRSRSRSPVRSRSPHRRQNRSPSFSRSPSRSRSPKKKRVVDRERRTKSSRYSRSPSRSPEPRDSPQNIPTPKEDIISPSPERVNSEYSLSPQRAKTPSPATSPADANGPNRSPIPTPVDGSPAGGDEET